MSQVVRSSSWLPAPTMRPRSMTMMRSQLRIVPRRVGDHERGALVDQAVDRLLNQGFALGVHLAGGFVEDEDGRGPQDGAGDVQALALPAGEASAQLAQLGVVALGFLDDEIVGERLAGSLLDLLAQQADGGCLVVQSAHERVAVGDVLGDGARGTARCPGLPR